MLTNSNDKNCAVVSDSIIKRLEALGALHKELLYEKLDSERTRCNICQRRCAIKINCLGYCKTKLNISGDIYTTIYGVVSAAAADPIEKKPVFHYKPGSICYSIGSLGCNFRCDFCQNWHIAYSDGVSEDKSCRYGFAPENLIAEAKRLKAQGIAWTYNEPAIWLSYAIDSAKLARSNGFYTVYVTNGYATPEGLDAIGPYLDVYRVDIKSFSDDFYNKLINVPSASGIREVAVRAKHKWGMHIECVTNIIPGWNDSEDNLNSLAGWIADNLGIDTPWHVTRFFPHAKMQNVPPTPIETLKKAMQIGRKAGLRFVYPGNADLNQDTLCPTCGDLIIERSHYRSRLAVQPLAGKCPKDGTFLNIHI